MPDILLLCHNRCAGTCWRRLSDVYKRQLAAQSDEDAQAQALEAVAAYTQTFNKMGFIEKMCIRDRL